MRATFEMPFNTAKLNSIAGLIKVVICCYRIDEFQNPFTKQVRYLDKEVDDLADGKKTERGLRTQ